MPGNGRSRAHEGKPSSHENASTGLGVNADLGLQKRKAASSEPAAFGGEIDPTRSDCATDFLSVEDFEREVRREWEAWVHYGTVKLPKDMDEATLHIVAKRQLEDFLERPPPWRRATSSPPCMHGSPGQSGRAVVRRAGDTWSCPHTSSAARPRRRR